MIYWVLNPQAYLDVKRGEEEEERMTVGERGDGDREEMANAALISLFTPVLCF